MSGGSNPTSQTNTTNMVAPYAAPYAQNLLGQTAAVTDISQNPYQSYGGQQVAGEIDGEEGVPFGERDGGQRAGAQDAGLLDPGAVVRRVAVLTVEEHQRQRAARAHEAALRMSGNAAS